MPDIVIYHTFFSIPLRVFLNAHLLVLETHQASSHLRSLVIVAAWKVLPT